MTHVAARPPGPRRPAAAGPVEARRDGPAPLATGVRAHAVPAARRPPRLAGAPPALLAGARPRPLPLLPPPLRAGRPHAGRRPRPRRPARPAAAGEARDPGARPGHGGRRLAGRRPDRQPDGRLDGDAGP